MKRNHAHLDDNQPARTANTTAAPLLGSLGHFFRKCLRATRPYAQKKSYNNVMQLLNEVSERKYDNFRTYLDENQITELSLRAQLPADFQLKRLVEATDNTALTDIDLAGNRFSANNIQKSFKLAVLVGNLIMVRALLNAGAIISTHSDSSDIHLAAEYGKLAVVQEFIARGYGIDFYDKNNRTPLHLAALGGYLSVVKELISRGAKIEERDKYGNTPLHLAASRGRIAVVKEFIARGAQLQAANANGATPLHLAAVNGRLTVVQELIAHVAIDIRDTKNRTPLHWAAEHGKLAVVKELIARGADTQLTDANGSTPLHLAAENGRLNVVQELIPQGARLEPHILSTALTLAASNGHLDVFRELIARGADIQAATSNNGTTLLHLAAVKGHLTIVQELIARGADIQVTGRKGYTSLHLAAQKGHLAVVKELIAHGAAIQSTTHRNNTPLHLAARYGHLPVVQELIAQGADIHAVRRGDETPIVAAFENGHLEIINFLRGLGAQLPERLRARAAVRRVNAQQSTHNVSVHVGVSESAKRLKAYYLPDENKLAFEIVENAVSELESFIEALPYTEADGIMHPHGAAKRCLKFLKDDNRYEFVDDRSKITLKEALALVWIALRDPKELFQKRAQTGKQSSNRVLSFDPTPEEMQDFTLALTKGLYEIIRGDNLSSIGVDDGLDDNHICPPGSFNKIIEILNGRHNLVHIPLVNGETIKAKADVLIKAIFDELPAEQQRQFALALDESSLSNDFIEHLKPALNERLHAEFDPFQSGGCDVNKIISDYLENLQYLPPPRALLAFKEKLEQEATAPIEDEQNLEPRYLTRYQQRLRQRNNDDNARPRTRRRYS